MFLAARSAWGGALRERAVKWGGLIERLEAGASRNAFSYILMLRLIPGAAPQMIETSCCGMAGDFGYGADHYGISMKMGELALFPAVRKHADAVVVADGTSCRHQIADGTARRAIHAARLLERQL